ncbi:MAG: hypothetical protein ABR509_03860 [Candidatus Limnocylindria bacterium]
MTTDDFPRSLDDPEAARDALADVPGEEGEPSELPDAAPMRLPDENPDVEPEL